MLIYEASVPVPLDEVPGLIAYLEEGVLEHWSLHENVLTHEYALKGYFEDPSELKDSYAALRHHCHYLPLAINITALDDKTWQEAYKIYLKPWVCDRLHWVPEWHWKDYVFPEGAVAVCLEPGMAFGTGSHETTRLVAMRLLDIYHGLKGQVDSLSLTDAGCGSGILALTAYKLGFGKVMGFDIDPEAVRISREHLALNRCDADAVLFEVAGLPDGVMGRSTQILLANIQTEVLVPHAQAIVNAVKGDGFKAIILSGILTKELAVVKAAYAPFVTQAGLLYDDTRAQGDWSDLYFSNQPIFVSSIIA